MSDRQSSLKLKTDSTFAFIYSDGGNTLMFRQFGKIQSLKKSVKDTFTSHD